MYMFFRFYLLVSVLLFSFFVFLPGEAYAQSFECRCSFALLDVSGTATGDECIIRKGNAIEVPLGTSGDIVFTLSELIRLGSIAECPILVGLLQDTENAELNVPGDFAEIVAEEFTVTDLESCRAVVFEGRRFSLGSTEYSYSLECLGIPVQEVGARKLAPPPEIPTIKLIKPLYDKNDPDNPRGRVGVADVLGVTINAAFGVVGSLALVAFVYGGILWLTSAGSPERIKKGAQVMMWVVIGLFVMFAAYAILNTIIRGLGAKGAGIASGNPNSFEV